MARLVTRSGRSRLPALLGAVLLAAAVLALGAFYLFPHPTGPTQNTPAEAASNPPTATQPATADAAPTGCLGGQQRDAAMVLAAQQQARHSAYGAVEVAAAFFRWGYRYPYPSAGDVQALRPFFVSKDGDALQRQLISSYDRPYVSPPGDGIASGTPYYLTTANGVWAVGDDSTRDQVVASAQMHYVIDDSYSSTQTVSLTAVLVWQNHSWHLSALRQSDAQRLANGGTSFTSGC